MVRACARGLPWVLLALIAASGAPARADAPDAARDPRLARPITVRSPGIPVSRVLRAISERTGVSLTAAGTAGDERLVAFARDVSLAEFMASVAELYRLDWTRGGGKSPSYRLAKAPEAAREEQARRDRAVRQVLDALRNRYGRPGPPPAETGRVDPLRSIAAEVSGLLSERGAALAREGWLYQPLAALPERSRLRLAEKLGPDLRELDRQRDAHLAGLREEMRQMGVPEAGLADAKPPTRAEECTVTFEIALETELRLVAGLKTRAGTWYHSFTASADSLRGAALAFYAARMPRVPETAGGPAARGADADDPLHRPIEFPPDTPAGNWIAFLGRLSGIAGIPIYADCYPDFRDGIDLHPRGGAVRSGKGSPAQALDAVCFPLPGPAFGRKEANSFWWRRGSAALIRSRDWLWQAGTVLPAALPERLAASHRTRGRLSPEDLSELGKLTFWQLQGLGRLSRHLEEWHLSVRVPARLSPAARATMVERGLTWDLLPARDRATLAVLLGLPADAAVPGFRPRIRSEVRELPTQGGPALVLHFQAPDAPGYFPAYFVLPGAGGEESGLSVRTARDR